MLLVVSMALALRGAAQPVIGTGYLFVTIFPAITALAWWRGARVGLTGTVVGGALAFYFFGQPAGYFWPQNPRDWTGAILYAGSCGLIIGLSEQRSRALRVAGTGRQASALLKSIVENTSDAIVTKNLHGIITSWNAGAERVFGYTAKEVCGKSITILIPHGRLQEEALILSRVSQGERVTLDTERLTKAGRLIHVSVSVSPVRDDHGVITGASKIARDITDRKMAERERESLLASERSARSEAERLSRVKDDFLATLSHELRTPLTAILGWSQLIRKPETSAQEVAHGLAVIERNARAQSQMIEDLLDVSRIASGKLRLDVQRVNLTAVVEQAVASARPAADAKSIRLQCVLDPRSCTVNGDPTRLQQIVWNILSNALKFTPKGGRIQVVTRRVNSSVRLEISDSGKGINAKFLGVIFDRFRQEDSSTTRHYGGLGLGLAIVRQLTELHGGTVRASSDGEGKGATFCVELPLALLNSSAPARRADVDDREADPLPLAAPMPVLGRTLEGIRVLAVDDDNDSRELIVRVLHEHGAHVCSADCAAAALRHLSTFQPHVILSDIGMPDQDGFEFIATVRSKPADQGGAVPAAALTALARTEDRTRALMAGFQVHVAKPVEPSGLVAVVAALARLGIGRSTEPRNGGVAS
ncbi:MAG: Sensor histidine kinase RcsC [Phycisphaerales bacterium]|nr:Sensor histidine kinase RcsC [Phycisphaerales bacterium]